MDSLTDGSSRKDGKQPLLRRLRAAKSMPGREIEQGFVRVVIVTCVFAYLLLSFHGVHPPSRELLAGASALWVIALGIFVAIIVRPEKSVRRRVFSIAFDMGAITWCMYSAGAVGAPLYPLYLWVTFGNGFRFGLAYLYMSSALALIGFSLVIALTPFWHQHLALSSGLLLGLIVLPLYLSTLLRRLKDAARRAEDASLTKSRFLANMSHELRTPLNGIVGVADSLRETPLDREQKESVETITSSVTALLALIENIVDISRIEAGTLTVERTDFDLHSVLNGAARIMRIHAEEKHLQLTLHVAPEVPFQLRGDPHRVRQVLINLLGNAIKFTDRGHVEIRVSLADNAGTTARVRFEISDTGIGIPEAALGQIFESFASAGDAAPGRRGGTGLGATISKELVELMGGRIGVTSRVGQGSSFWFELPFERQEPPAERFKDLTNARVLIISDLGPTYARLLEYLSSWAVRSETVDNASAAFASINQALQSRRPYHVVIVDKPLIDIDAAQFAQALRARSLLSSIGLVLIARDDSTEPHRRLLRAGYACILRAPVDKTLLFNALHAAPMLEPTQDSQVVDLRTRQAPPTPRLRARILVAEENPIDQKTISDILKRSRFEVDLVGNGEEALDALESQRYNAVIVDMQMPVMGGIQTAKLFRFIHPERADLPFIMLMASSAHDAQDRSDEAGIVAYLPKPVDAERLIAAVENVLSSSPAAGRADASARPASDNGGAPESPVVLNSTSLRELEELGYGSDFFHDLIQGFIRDGNALLDQMLSAIERSDFADFRDINHSLKGNAGSIGAVSLYKACARTERLHRSDFERTARQVLEETRTEFRRACAALIEYSKRLSGAHH